MSSLFTYQTLDGKNPVRFLRLLPSELDGVIRCEIYHDDLSSHQSYNAVSYTWGPPEPTVLIQINGKQLPVRENLFLFLRTIVGANSDSIQRLWIDALCIDQNNIEEKNQQVLQMGRIYSCAQSVLIWLGPASGETNFAFDAFESVRKQLNDMQNGDALTNPSVLVNALPASEEFELSMLDLLNREYWTRVWIVQELFLTTRGRVICGARIMRLEDLEKYCSNMRFLNMLSCQKLQTSPGFKICCRAARYKTDRLFGKVLPNKEKTASTHHAWALVNWMVDQQCSDPRDKLYGLLGIATDGPGFVVDYSSCCASLLFKAIKHFPLLNSIHSADHLRKLLGLTTEDLAEYIRACHDRHEEEIWISVFMEPFSKYVGDRDQVFDCRPLNNGVVLQADDIIFDFDGRDDVPKEVLLFRKEASSYICLAVVSVYPLDPKEPPICRNKEVPPRHILIGLVDGPIPRSLKFSDIRQRSHGGLSSENVEIPIPLEVLLFLMWCQTPFESTKGLPPEAIRGNPLQAVSWCRSRRDASRRSSDWHNLLRYKGSGNPGLPYAPAAEPSSDLARQSVPALLHLAKDHVRVTQLHIASQMAYGESLGIPIITGPSPRAGSLIGKRPVTVDSAEEYARIVDGHANPPSAQSLYCGANYASFAAFLQRPYQPTAIVNSETAPEQATYFATVHDFSLPEEDERRINRFCTVQAFEKMIEEKKKHIKPSLLVFLQGHPSPEWLNTIGYLCNVDPEFLLRHLNFRIPPADRHFTSPALPSTSNNIIQLRITSIICREQPQGGQVEVDQSRKDAEDGMKEYYKHLKKEINVKTGDSIVRSFVVHDNSHSTLEQDISICVNEFEKGWIGVAWLDHGNDLSQGPAGPWSSQIQRSRSWKTLVIPTILHRPGIALKTPYIAPRQIQHDRNLSVEVGQPKYPQLACSIHIHYGRFLDEKSAKIDPFYALSELLTFAATSEAQFLNLVEEKIVFETTRLLNTETNNTSSRTTASNSTLSNLWCSKKALDEHLRRLKEIRALIDHSGGPKWPKATEEEPDVYAKVRATRDMLIGDYDYLLERARTLSKSCDRGMDVAGNNALIAESRSAIQQAEWVAKLTLLAFFFIPASFSTSVFGMNFVQFGQGSLSIWLWIVLLVPTYMISLFVLYFDWGYFRVTRTILSRANFNRKKLGNNV